MNVCVCVLFLMWNLVFCPNFLDLSGSAFKGKELEIWVHIYLFLIWNPDCCSNFLALSGLAFEGKGLKVWICITLFLIWNLARCPNFLGLSWSIQFGIQRQRMEIMSSLFFFHFCLIKKNWVSDWNCILMLRI